MPPNHHNSNVTSTRLARSSPLSKMDQQYNPLSLAAISNYKLAQLTFAPPDSHSIRKRTLVKNMLELLYEVTPPEWLDQMTRWEFISPDQVAIPPDGIESIINEYAEVIYNTSGMDPMDDDEEFHDMDDDDYYAREREANMFQDDEDMWIDDDDDDQFLSAQRRNLKRISANENGSIEGKPTGNNLYGMSNEQLSSASITSLASKSAGSITSAKDNGGSEKEEVNYGVLEGDSPHPLQKPTQVQKPPKQRTEKTHPLPPIPTNLPNTNPFRANSRLSWATQSTLFRTAPIAASPARFSTDLSDLFNMSFDVGHLEINTAPKLPTLSFQPEETSPIDKHKPPTPVKDDSFLVALLEAASRSSANVAGHSSHTRDSSRLRSPSLGNIPPPPNEPPPPVPTKDDVGRTHAKRSSSLPDVRLPDAGRWTIRKMPALPPVQENDQGKEQGQGLTPRRTSSLSRKSTPRSLSSIFDPPTASGKFVPVASDAFSTLQKYLATEAGAQQAKNVGFSMDGDGSANGKPKRKKSDKKKKLSMFGGRKTFSIPSFSSLGSSSTNSSSTLSLSNSPNSPNNNSQTFFAQPPSQSQSRSSLDKALPPSPEDRSKNPYKERPMVPSNDVKLRRTSSLVASTTTLPALPETNEGIRGRERSASSPNIAARALTPPRSGSPPPTTGFHVSKSKKRRSGQSVAFRRATPSVSPSPSNPRISETEGLTSTPGGGVGYTPSSSNSTSSKSKNKELRLHSSDPALSSKRTLPALPTATTPPRSPTSPRLDPRRVSTSLYGDVIDGVLVPSNSGGIGMGSPSIGISNGGRIGFHGPPPTIRSSNSGSGGGAGGAGFMKKMKDLGKLMKKGGGMDMGIAN